MKKYLFIFLGILGVSAYANIADRTEIGQHAYINVDELNTKYLSRIDTGAKITSLHALNIRLVDENGNDVEEKSDKADSKIKNAHYKDNKGKFIMFDSINELGKKVSHKSKIVEVSLVKNAQGREYRYVVDLTLTYKGVSKIGHVNLRDRSKMEYKLLIGRNWLHDDFYVITDKKHHD